MDLLKYWAKAAKSEIGYAIATEDGRKLAAELYKAREGHPEYGSIRICHPAGGHELWLVKQTLESVELAARRAAAKAPPDLKSGFQLFADEVAKIVAEINERHR